jgi:hypothetical protein
MRARDIMLRHRLPLLALALAAVVAGCSTPPTAPGGGVPAAGGAEGGGSELLAMSQDGRAWFTTVAADTDSVAADYTLDRRYEQAPLHGRGDRRRRGRRSSAALHLAVPPKASRAQPRSR